MNGPHAHIILAGFPGCYSTIIPVKQNVPRNILRRQYQDGQANCFSIPIYICDTILWCMSRWVGVAEGVAQDIGVAIEGLGRRRVGDQAVGTDEFAQGRVVVAGLVVVQPQAGVPALAGVHGDMYEVASGGAVVRLTLVAKEVVFCKGSQGCVVCKDVAQVVGVRPLVAARPFTWSSPYFVPL